MIYYNTQNSLEFMRSLGNLLFIDSIYQMRFDEHIVVFDWYANQFTLSRRIEFIENIYPRIKKYIKPGYQALDLCCGAGSITVFLHEQGLEITGIDLSPALIRLARLDAQKRGVRTSFEIANVLSYQYKNDMYDLVFSFGNGITDFPHNKFQTFVKKVYDALQSGGHFIIEYIDGLNRIEYLSKPKEVVEQGVDSQIKRRFIEYNPQNGQYIMEFTNLSTFEKYECIEYVYTRPMVKLLLEKKFIFIKTFQLKNSFIDIYFKK